jgi:hypothetical protein
MLYLIGDGQTEVCVRLDLVGYAPVSPVSGATGKGSNRLN